MNILYRLRHIFYGHESKDEKSSTDKAVPSPIESATNEVFAGIKFPGVYYVSKDDTKKFNFIAIAPTLDAQGGRLQWRDTGRGASVAALEILLDSVEIEPKVPKEIKIITPEGQEVILTYLENDFYEKNLRKFVEGGPTYQDTKDLQNTYLKRF